MKNDIEMSQRRIVSASAILGSFLTPFMSSSVNIALPSIGAEFGAATGLLSWTATVFLLSAAVFLVPFGRIADIRGRKRVFAWGMLLYAFSSLACALAPGIGPLIAARFFQGAGGAMIYGTGTAMLASAYPSQERGRVIGLSVAAAYIGLSLGPFAGGIVTEHLGWRALFLINAVIGAGIYLLVHLRLKEDWAESAGEGFDLPGSLLYAGSLLLLMYGLSVLPGLSGYALIGAGIILGLIFIRFELRAAYPVFSVTLFSGNRGFAFSNLAALINYAATFGVGFLLSLFLQYAKDLTPQEAGSILMIQAVMQALFSPLAGRLSDRTGARVLASLGMALTAAGLFFFVFLTGSTSLYSISAGLALLGFGFALFSSPNTSAIMGFVEKRQYGLASASVATMRLFGQMLSMGTAQLIIVLSVGENTIGPANLERFMQSVRLSFLVFTVLCLIGIGASLARGKPSNP